MIFFNDHGWVEMLGEVLLLILLCLQSLPVKLVLQGSGTAV